MSESNIGEQGLAQELEPRINALVLGVGALAVIRGEQIPRLTGSDTELYARLLRLAVSSEAVAEADQPIGDTLKNRRRGLRRRKSADTEQGVPLEMTATLAHEYGHGYTPAAQDPEAERLSEIVAEGTAFVVCDYYGLDISPRAFPYIASYSKSTFTPEMLEGIRTASTEIIQALQAQQ